MDTAIGRIERNDYTVRCPVDGCLMHFLEEIDEVLAAYYCKFCGKVRMGSWKQ